MTLFFWGFEKSLIFKVWCFVAIYLKFLVKEEKNVFFWSCDSLVIR